METNPILFALMAGLFTWGMTSAGAALVFFFKTINKNVLNIMLGFAAGVMVAASFWSLLLPAQEIAKEAGMIEWMPLILGFAAGGIVLMVMDKLLPHLHPNSKDGKPEGMDSNLKKKYFTCFCYNFTQYTRRVCCWCCFWCYGK